MCEIAIDAVQYLDRLWMDPGSVVCGYWSDLCRACVIGGPAKVQFGAQGTILEVNQGQPTQKSRSSCSTTSRDASVP